MSEPILYLSLYFKQNRDIYYELLQKVRTKGDWESWLRFLETLEQAVATARALLTLFDADCKKVETLKRPAASALWLHQYLQTKSLTSIQAAAALTLTLPTVTTALAHLEKLGIVKELTGRQRNRMFYYENYLRIPEQGTIPKKR